ncbi:MAG: VTT domain-containing protein, partial [Deltaproteobacteria bacterium]|nr:VTT domain-containing protein [Deltaproteobacteria bacterium]
GFPMKKYAPKIILVIALLTAAVSFFVFDLEQYFTLENLKEHQQAFEDYYQHNKFLTITLYFIGYVVMAALSLPGAAVMTLAGGVLLGLGVGTLVVSFASSIGATLAFLVARFLLRESVQGKFGEKLTTINEGVRKGAQIGGKLKHHLSTSFSCDPGISSL